MGGRICVLCYAPTIGNNLFCKHCYLENKETIDAAIETDAEWLIFLRRYVDKEHYQMKKQRREVSWEELGGEERFEKN